MEARRSMEALPRGVVRATPALVRRLAASLAPEHAREVRELSRLTPIEAIKLSLTVSRETYVALNPHGIPLFLMGVEPAGLVGRSALVWMLASPAARIHPARVLRCARWGIERAFEVSGAETLVQFIPGWYAVGLAFAARLGFALSRLPGRADVFLATLCFPDFKSKGVKNGSGNHKHP